MQPNPDSPVEREPSARETMPDLRFVPTESLVPHEEHDNQRSEPLIKRIADSGVWVNPPVVAPMGDGRYVILDGANRHHVAMALGFPHILVQVVTYESGAVRLDTWQHVISGLSWFDFLRHIRGVPGVSLECTELLTARAELARRQLLAYSVLSDGHAYAIQARTQTLAQQNTILCQLVNTYKDRGRLNRINTDSLALARRLHPEAVAIVVFPHYEPAEIVVAARDHLLLPPGISRHIVHGRAMRLNYPLETLRDPVETLEEKNHKLQLWIQRRTAEKRIRYYAEPMFLFDE